MLTIWGRMSSVNVQKVVWIAGELKEAFERIDVGGPFGGLDAPDFLAMNPFGLIPVVKDGDVVLSESNTILRYLAATRPAGGFHLADPVARARAERWMDLSAFTMAPAMAPAFMGLVRTPPERRDDAAIAASQARVERLFGLMDEALGQSAYLSGDAFGVADIAVAVLVHRWLNMPLEAVQRPRTQAWYRTLRERPAAAAALVLPVA